MKFWQAVKTYLMSDKARVMVGQVQEEFQSSIDFIEIPFCQLEIYTIIGPGRIWMKIEVINNRRRKALIE